MKPNIIELCVEGTKGAGKSTTIAKLKSILENRGWPVEVVAVFADANDHARELGHAGSVPMFAYTETHQAIVSFEVERFRSARADYELRLIEMRARRGVLIYDRGWMTFHAHIFDGAYNEPTWRSTLWEDALAAAPPTLFIYTHPDVTARRRRGELDTVSGLQDHALVVADWEKRLAFAESYASKLIGSIETNEEDWVDTTTLGLTHIFESAGISDAAIRASTQPSFEPLGQHFLNDPNSLRPLSSLQIEGRAVLEVGVGTGVVTREILKHRPSKVVGIEIDGLIVPDDVRSAVTILECDVASFDPRSFFSEPPVLVCAPPYDELDLLKSWIANGGVSDVMMMVPEEALADFPSFEIVSRLDGDYFDPPSLGAHFWITRMFVRSSVEA